MKRRYQWTYIQGVGWDIYAGVGWKTSIRKGICSLQTGNCTSCGLSFRGCLVKKCFARLAHHVTELAWRHSENSVEVNMVKLVHGLYVVSGSRAFANAQFK